MATEPSESGSVISERKLRWSIAAAFVVGIAAVLLFFVFYGIPSEFESYAHRNDERWQERNNLTTTTAVSIAAPLDDAFRSGFERKLGEAVKQLRLWEALSRHRWWESLSLEMQCTYDPGASGYPDSAVPSVVECVEHFASLPTLFPAIYRGESVDFWEVESSSYRAYDPGWRSSSAYWPFVREYALGLLDAMREDLNKISTSLLWTTATQGYTTNEADRLFILSWHNTRDDIEWPLHDAESDLDLAYSEWYLAKDKAERPERYIGSD